MIQTSTEKENKQKTVVVLGIPRSGTSMVAGMLKILGVNMGPNITITKFTPKGSFEDSAFNKMDHDILRSAGGNYWHPPKYEKILKQKNAFTNKIKKLIKKRGAKQTIWGWKHPATHLTIELYLPHLLYPHFIIVTRSPLKIAKSAIKMGQQITGKTSDLEYILKMINLHQRQILTFLEEHPNLPKIFISFEDIINNPIKEVKRLASFLGLELTKEKINQVKEFVIPRNKIQVEKRKAYYKNLIAQGGKIIKEKGLTFFLVKIFRKIKK